MFKSNKTRSCKRLISLDNFDKSTGLQRKSNKKNYDKRTVFESF